MKSVIFVSCLLMISLLSQSQPTWVPETGKVYYLGGNVGIGTSTPERPLHVEGASTFNGDVKMNHQNELGYGRALWFGTATTNTDPFLLVRYNIAADQSEFRMFLGDDGGDRIAFGYNSGGPGGFSHNATITASGAMSLGTSYIPTGYKLAVHGNIIAERVKVQLRNNWPDYVFSPAYQLPSLKKVEQFIRQHKHLPEVPSAKEVEKNGIELGDNQALLLKKIEELTLYLIEQNKKLEDQNKRIQKLETANEQLRLEKKGIKLRKKP